MADRVDARTMVIFEFTTSGVPRVEMLPPEQVVDGRLFRVVLSMAPEDVTALQELLQEVQRAIYHHYREGLLLDHRSSDELP